MAGTRLLLQSIVLIELIIIVWISIQYGFCYSSQGTSPTTKDIPRLIFLTDNNSDDPKMNQEWWEESLCHPIHSILISKYFDFDFEGNDHDKAVEDEVVEESDNDSNDDIIDLSLFEQFYKNTKITLVLENVTQLTYWIDYFTNELSELVLVQLDDTDTNDDDNTDNNTDNTDYANNNFKMDLEIIRPAAALLAPLLEEEEKEDDQDQLLWENYLNQQSSASISTINTNTMDKQHNLVIYVPSNLLLLLDEAPSPSWKSIEEGNVNVNANPSETTMTKMTMIVPALLSSSSLSSSSSSSPLKSLIESWMIRSTIDISSSSHKTSSNKNRNKNRKSSSAKKRKKLVRNFPFEHFLAVLMPLLFPLLFPFLISWIKEYLRYKNKNNNKLKEDNKDKKLNAVEENTNTNTDKLKDKDKKEIK